MKSKIGGYSVGPLLYCPALNSGVASKLIKHEFGYDVFSVAFCLEDTTNPKDLSAAELQLETTLVTLRNSGEELPKIFVRPRSVEQLEHLMDKYSQLNLQDTVTGFIAPKFNSSSAESYLRVIESSEHDYLFMPILECGSLINPLKRAPELNTIKAYCKAHESKILNIRVGGNDLCNALGLRRHSYQTIYDILPVANALSDIISVFADDFIVSGPVWEYYGGDWTNGFKTEVRKDVLNGFVGKTLIHPRQIKLYNQLMKQDATDVSDAKIILTRDETDSYVWGNGERMQELNCHRRWAKRTLRLSEVYGVL